MNTLLLSGDKKIIGDIVKGAGSTENIFFNNYRQQIYDTFANSHRMMNLKIPLTDKTKNEILKELWSNLLASKDQLLRYTKDGRSFSLSAYLEIKASYFFRDKLLVEYLKKRDTNVTEHVFSCLDKYKYISFYPIIIKELNDKKIYDFENNGKIISVEKVRPELYLRLMDKLDAFQFKCSLKTYFLNTIMRSFINAYYKEKNRVNQEIDFDTSVHCGTSEIIDTVFFNDQERDKFFNGLFNHLIKNGTNKDDIDILKEHIFSEKTYKEIAINRRIKTDNVGVIIFRTKKKLLKAASAYKRNYFI